MMFNPLLKMTKADLKSICFGCAACSNNPFDVFVSNGFLQDTVWIRTEVYGAYFDYGTRRAGRAVVSRSDYILGRWDIKVSSYEELVQIMVSRGYKDWFSR